MKRPLNCVCGTLLALFGLHSGGLISAQEIRYGLHIAGSDRQLLQGSSADGRRQIVDWYVREPARQDYRFDSLDALVAGDTQMGMDVVLTLRSDSNWATEIPVSPDIERNYDQPDSSAIVSDDWRNYVTELVERYDGDGVGDIANLGGNGVRTWQLSNEFLAQWKGTEQQFIDWMSITYTAIKNADPTAMVVSPALTGTHIFALRDGFNTRGWTFTGSSDDTQLLITEDDLAGMEIPLLDLTTRVLQNASDSYDIVDLHMYNSMDEDAAFSIDWVRSVLGEEGADKPIWSTEFASPFFDWSEEKFSRAVITAQVTAFAAGLDRIYWSSFEPAEQWNENYTRLALTDFDDQPTAAYYAYAFLAEQTAGFETVSAVDVPVAGAQSYEFTFADRDPLTVSWNANGIQFRDLESTILLPNAILGRDNADCSGDGIIDRSDAACHLRAHRRSFVALYRLADDEAAVRSVPEPVPSPALLIGVPMWLLGRRRPTRTINELG